MCDCSTMFNGPLRFAFTLRLRFRLRLLLRLRLRKTFPIPFSCSLNPSLAFVSDGLIRPAMKFYKRLVAALVGFQQKSC